jgi:hypothetical protein
MTIPLALVLGLAVVQRPCEPARDIQVELQAAASVEVKDVADFDRNIAPLQDLRARHPDDLFVHERYQDGVNRHGIEGHLKEMLEEYQRRAIQHPDDVVSQYLFARALIGRTTQSAIQALAGITTDHPEFAPAHRALAAIYSSQTYRDEQRVRAEQKRFLALCPCAELTPAELTPWPVTLPSPSPLMDAAERLLDEHGDTDRAVTLALQGIRDDEWRLQRMRPFDWYSVDDKRRTQRELLTKYWRLWSLQVRSHRRAGRPEQASQLLAQMERRANTLYTSQEPACWDALAILARLYVEGGQKDLAGQRIEDLRRLLAEHPSPDHAVTLEKLQKQIAGSAP